MKFQLREADSYIVEQKTLHKKRRRFLLACAGALFVGLLAIGVGWVTIESPVFQIKAWNIEGNKFTESEAIRNFLDIKVLTASLPNTVLGFRNMIAWQETSFENYAPELPRVKRMDITKDYTSRTIEVTVEERTPFGIWCVGAGKPAKSTPLPKPVAVIEITRLASSTASSTEEGVLVEEELLTAPAAINPSCFWFDADGVLLDYAPYASGNLIPVVHDYSGKYLRSQIKAHTETAMQNLVTVFEALRAANLSVREVRLEDRGLEEVKVILNRGPELYFSLRFPANEAVPVVASLRKSGFANLEYVDFRVEHRAYYK